MSPKKKKSRNATQGQKNAINRRAEKQRASGAGVRKKLRNSMNLAWEKARVKKMTGMAFKKKSSKSPAKRKAK
jgi:hypothetical protein